MTRFSSFRQLAPTEKEFSANYSTRAKLLENLETYRRSFRVKNWRALTDGFYLIYLAFIKVSEDLKPLEKVLGKTEKLVEELSAIRKKMIIQKTLHSCQASINFVELVNKLEELKYLNKREGHNIRANMPEFMKPGFSQMPSQRNPYHLILLSFLLGKKKFDDTV